METLGVEYSRSDQFNVSPTAQVDVLANSAELGRQLLPMRWWLVPSWAKELTTKYSMFNARVESASRSPAFQGPYKNQRCVVPVSGYYEWTKELGKKVPRLIRPRSSSGLLLAGLWDRWGQGHDPVLSFTILTTAASESLRFIHPRQPVMLSPENAKDWLDVSIPTRDMESVFESRVPQSLEVVPVSAHVNNSSNQGPRCVESIGEHLVINQDPKGVTSN